MTSIENNYIEMAVTCNLYSNVKNLRTYLNYCYDGLAVEARVILDIGGGPGLVSLFSIAKGADSVLVLEPECDGCSSIRGARSNFLKLSEVFNSSLRMMTFQQETLQNFETEQIFDLIFLHNSVNHLDEYACETLRNNHQSRLTYQNLFKNIYNMMSEGGQLVIFDCSSENFFNNIGFKSPFMPTIEWHKHQTPEIWVQLLREVGFHDPVIDWTVPNFLGPYWKRKLNKRWISFYILSHFKLVMRR